MSLPADKLDEIAKAILDVLYEKAGGRKTLWDDWEEEPKAIWRRAAQAAVDSFLWGPVETELVP